jgi:hypothetical protein
MKTAAIKWGLAGLSVFAVGPLCAWLVARTSPDGLSPGTPLVSASPLLGAVGLLLALAIVAGLGMVVARVASARWGFFCAGLALCWAAAHTASLSGPTGLIRPAAVAGEIGGVSMRLLVEGLVCLVVLAPAAVFMWMRGSHPQGEAGASQRGDPADTTAMAMGVGIGLLGAAAGVWMVAITGLKGQAIAGAAVGGLAAGFAGHLLAHRAPGFALALGALLLCVLAPAAGLFMGPRGIPGALAAGGDALMPLLRLTPLDVAAGVLLGLPMGHGWAASIVDKRVPEAEVPTPPAPRPTLEPRPESRPEPKPEPRPESRPQVGPEGVPAGGA